MPKAQNNQPSQSDLKLTERVTLVSCIITIAAAFALMGVFFTLSWVFLLIFIADLVALSINKVPSNSKPLLLFISIIGAVIALLFVAVSRPWVFQ